MSLNQHLAPAPYAALSERSTRDGCCHLLQGVTEGASSRGAGDPVRGSDYRKGQPSAARVLGLRREARDQEEAPLDEGHHRRLVPRQVVYEGLSGSARSGAVGEAER